MSGQNVKDGVIIASMGLARDGFSDPVPVHGVMLFTHSNVREPAYPRLSQVPFSTRLLTSDGSAWVRADVAERYVSLVRAVSAQLGIDEGTLLNDIFPIFMERMSRVQPAQGADQ